MSRRCDHCDAAPARSCLFCDERYCVRCLDCHICPGPPESAEDFGVGTDWLEEAAA